MKILSSNKSLEIVKSFLETLKIDTQKNKIPIEFFELTLTEPIYEKCNCAYIQTANEREAILYEAVTRKYFYIKAEVLGDKEKKSIPSLSILSSKVSSLFTNRIYDKMFWVCGNKKDESLLFEDFGTSFSLTKPI